MFSDTLKHLREIKGLNKAQLARKLELPYTTYNNYETGTREPNSEILIKISKEFNVTIDYLLGVEEKAENKDKELQDYLEVLKNRPEMRMLFQLSKDATKEDVEKAVAIIEAIRK